MFGSQRRLVFFLDQGTLWPNPGLLPHTSHTAATGVRSQITSIVWRCPAWATGKEYLTRLSAGQLLLDVRAPARAVGVQGVAPLADLGVRYVFCARRGCPRGSPPLTIRVVACQPGSASRGPRSGRPSLRGCGGRPASLVIQPTP